jgi:hypothetical protein
MQPFGFPGICLPSNPFEDRCIYVYWNRSIRPLEGFFSPLLLPSCPQVRHADTRIHAYQTPLVRVSRGIILNIVKIHHSPWRNSTATSCVSHRAIYNEAQSSAYRQETTLGESSSSLNRFCWMKRRACEVLGIYFLTHTLPFYAESPHGLSTIRKNEDTMTCDGKRVDPKSIEGKDGQRLVSMSLGYLLRGSDGYLYDQKSNSASEKRGYLDMELGRSISSVRYRHSKRRRMKWRLAWVIALSS